MNLQDKKAMTCIPLTAGSREELEEQLQKTIQAAPDLAEWRLDFWKDAEKWRFQGISLSEIRELQKLLIELREKLGDIKLILTLRHPSESGTVKNEPELSLKPIPYDKMLMEACLATGKVDYLDTELARGRFFISMLQAECRRHGTRLILSHHNFVRTPSAAELQKILKNEEQSGADVLKIAVMPNQPGDVDTLKYAVSSLSSDRPVIAVSMGEMGKESRIYPEAFGSCLTFVTAGASSAPGQISIETYREMRK